ncbi:MAG: NUDIX domain-containing protein [Pseudomonadota bacterium]
MAESKPADPSVSRDGKSAEVPPAPGASPGSHPPAPQPPAPQPPFVRPAAQPPFVRQVPDGDSRARLVCADCGFVNYENPKVVVGAVVRHEGRILMCRRAIDPRRGFWTLPAGYLELNETTPEGAKREAWEEARAKIEIEGLLAVYSIPRLSQVQVMFRARLAEPAIAPGPESLEVRLFAWDEIPWAEIAFPSVRWALGHDREIGEARHFAARTNPPGELGNY